MTDIIFQNSGTIDKFIGDAIMTIFGAPIQSKDDAYRAVKTAIEMKTKLEKFNSLHTELTKPLEIGIGIHTGEVIAGNIGSTKRLDYTVIGDNVNLASRIENLTKFYKCPIIISQTTLDELKEEIINSRFLTREVDTVIVKGKSNPIKIYEILCFNDDSEKKKMIERKNLFEHGLKLYKESKFEEAIHQFKNIEKDYLSELYIQRCHDFLKNPPDKYWDGIYTIKSK